jgi:hypothetical protein
MGRLLGKLKKFMLVVYCLPTTPAEVSDLSEVSEVLGPSERRAVAQSTIRLFRMFVRLIPSEMAGLPEMNEAV